MRISTVVFFAGLCSAVNAFAAADSYSESVAPVFNKYCTACHNAEDKEGGLALERHALLIAGGESKKPLIVAGKPDESRLIRLIEKKSKPFMPPEGSEGPTAAEIATIRKWIKAGARAPLSDAPGAKPLVTPEIKTKGDVRKAVHALSYSPDGKWLAVAGYGRVEILSGGRNAKAAKPARTLQGIAGHVNAVGFSADGKLFYAAAGEPGLFGEARVWTTADWKELRTFRGHNDALYSAAISPDGRLLATGSYDQSIRLWDLATGNELRALKGHNGAVFGLAFHPAGALIASASGDRTVKLWDVATGTRLDTLVEPEKDQYALALSPDGRHVVAGGVDNRIRVWRIKGKGREGTNPIRYTRFAHEAPILNLAYSPDGRVLVSSSEDGTIKLWETRTFTQLRTIPNQPDWVQALAISADNRTLAVGRLDGSITEYPISTTASAEVAMPAPLEGSPLPRSTEAKIAAKKLNTAAEAEPNDSVKQATSLHLPAKAAGVLKPNKGSSSDADLYRFHATAGEAWVVETNAARSKSPADTKIEVLDGRGEPVLRYLLRAVRDSYITFRPIDSNQDQVRVKNWEEMELNQYMYLDGEVCRIFRMPEGPDSGFQFYTINGKRRNYFDTSGGTHAKDNPVYIVEPYPAGTELIDNGLPVFSHYFANDDDGDRKLGTDSSLTFTAPTDGDYYIRVTDVRGFGGDEYKYTLTVRRPQPDFSINIGGKNATVDAGNGKRLTFTVDRKDGFYGPVRIDVENVPAGYSVFTPVVEARHVEARGVINAAADAKPATKEEWAKVKITAVAEINGKTVSHNVGDLGEIKLGGKPKLIVHLAADPQAEYAKSDVAALGKTAGETAPTRALTGHGSPDAGGSADADEPAPPALPEDPANVPASPIVIEPGTTVTAILRIERNGADGPLRFDVDNLPHGVIVDNLGLNGITLLPGQTERKLYITADAWVPETTRKCFAVCRSEANQASRPVRIIVRSRNAVADGR